MARYVIFTVGHFTMRDWTRFDCAEMATRGYTVVPVEIGQAFGWETSRAAVERDHVPGIVVLDDLAELERFVGTLDEIDMVLVLANLSTARGLFQVLSRQRVRYAVLQHRGLPMAKLYNWRAAVSLGEYFALKKEDAAGWLYRVVRFCKQVAANRFEYIRLRPPALWITSGSNIPWIESQLPKPWRATWRSIPHFDAIVNVSANGEPSDVQRVAIFLDEGFVDHPDFTILKVPPVATAATYWPAMERLFQAIERETNLAVIVARHPRSSGELPPGVRARIGNGSSTMELVRRSSLTICHASTSLSFAVMFRKPILFVTTAELEQSKFRGIIARISSFFGQRRINADDFQPGDARIPAINEDKYDAFARMFLRPEGLAQEGLASTLIALAGNSASADLPNSLRRSADGQTVRRDRVTHDRTGADHAVRSNVGAGQ